MRINKLNLIAVSFVALAATSCSDDFLNTSSKTELNSSSFYKTQVQAEYALTGCYDKYQRTVSDGAWPGMYLAAEFGSDDCFGGGSPTDGCDRFDKMDTKLATDKDNTFESLWKLEYQAIYNANLLIASVDNITFSSDDTKNAVAGEVRALRGLEYFDLVRIFEKVPLLTAPSTEVVPQSTPDSIYAQIVSDLEYAAKTIPATSNTDNSKYLGHISKYAAEAMLARVYLFYDGVYNNNGGGTMPGGLTKAQALAYCEDVISSGVYKLESDFSTLWPAACAIKMDNPSGEYLEDKVLANYKEASQEFLWVVKFNNDQNYTSTNGGNPDGNRFICDLGLRGVSSGAGAPYAQGWGQCPVSSVAYNMFDSSDSRRTASIIDCKSLGVYNTQIATDEMDYTGYVNKKYCPVCYTNGGQITYIGNTVAGDWQLSQDQNWVLMRYSDVLLMAAELGSANATKYFNLVRERAYGTKDHDLASAPTTEQIWTERRKEFVCEGIRYFDLMRQGLDRFVSALANQGTTTGTAAGASQTVYSNRVQTSIASDYSADNFRATRGFWQIPTNQITLSGGVYSQNAGW